MREQRLVFGADAEMYDSARPSYPAELIDDVLRDLDPPVRAVDLGCGTAKAAVLLAARGVVGVGIEPDPAMASVAGRRLKPFPGWRVDVSDFETWSGTDTESRIDLVTCAQAWHWLDPSVRVSRSAALLRPGGRLALWWNRPGDDDSPLRREMTAVYEDLAPELPMRGIGAKGRPTVPADPPGFHAVSEKQYEWTASYSASEWTDLMRTQSDHALMAAEQRARLLAALSRVIDANGGVYHHLYSCWLWMAERR